MRCQHWFISTAVGRVSRKNAVSITEPFDKRTVTFREGAANRIEKVTPDRRPARATCHHLSQLRFRKKKNSGVATIAVTNHAKYRARSMPGHPKNRHTSTGARAKAAITRFMTSNY